MDDDRNQMRVQKDEMRHVLQDLMLRIKKVEDAPREEHLRVLLDRIQSDRVLLDKMAHHIGGQILLDFNMFCSDLEQYLEVPDDKAAYPQVADGAAILLHGLS